MRRWLRGDQLSRFHKMPAHDQQRDGHREHSTSRTVHMRRAVQKRSRPTAFTNL